jgi:hypothetical protein
MVAVTVKLYARLMELASSSSARLELEMPGKPCLKDLLEKLSERFGTHFKNVLTGPSDEYGHYFLSILISARLQSLHAFSLFY